MGSLREMAKAEGPSEPDFRAGELASRNQAAPSTALICVEGGTSANTTPIRGSGLKGSMASEPVLQKRPDSTEVPRDLSLDLHLLHPSVFSAVGAGAITAYGGGGGAATTALDGGCGGIESAGSPPVTTPGKHSYPTSHPSAHALSRGSSS